MRVQIDGERQIVSGLAGVLPEVEPVIGEPDLTEQKFGFAEVASIVGTVLSVAELAKIIVEHVQKPAARAEEGSRPQTLRLRSAIGTVIVEVAPDTTVEDLEAALAPLKPDRR